MTTKEPSSWFDALLKAIQVVGFPIVAAMGIGWIAYTSIKWEREQMLPALDQSAKVINNNTQALQNVAISLEAIQHQSVAINKTTDKLLDRAENVVKATLPTPAAPAAAPEKK